MAPPLVQLKDIALTFGGTPLLAGVELSVSATERVCLVGRNGSGKSTLLKIAAGLIAPDRGTRFMQPGATVRYLPQEPDFAGAATTLAYVEAGLGPGDDRHQARYLLEQLGLDGSEEPARLSGGEARRAALARVLAPAPDILLLDEPTNHLDLTTIEWLERELAGRRAALVMISHDRRFLANLSRSTVWLDRGQTRRIERGFARRDGLPVSFRSPPAPYREAAFARGPGYCCVCGQPVYRFGWHRDLWRRGPNSNAGWHTACVVAWRLWNAPSDYDRHLKRLQSRRCATTGKRLWKTAEVDHRMPLFRVWREHRDSAWPVLLAFWGFPNLQVINREVHVAKCADEATYRGLSRASARDSDLGDNAV